MWESERKRQGKGDAVGRTATGLGKEVLTVNGMCRCDGAFAWWECAERAACLKVSKFATRVGGCCTSDDYVNPL